MKLQSRERYLLAAIEKEFVRIHAVGNGVPNKGKPVEDHRGFIGIFKQELPQNIEYD